MELLDRYLNAIKFWLPRAQQDDIVAELSEDIRSHIEEQEARLGRKLDDAEIATILKQQGRPLLVANRYLPQQHLIGPALFPVYRFVLTIVVLCYLVPWLLVWISLMIFDPSYRSTHAVWIDLARGGQSFWGATFFAIGTVTAVFAVLERVEARTRFLENWDPRKLPPVRDPNRILRFNSILELGANLIFLVWWVSGTWSQIIFNRSGVRVVLAPLWRGFLWAFLAIAVGNIALAAANLLYRQWTWPRALLRLALDGAGAAAFCWLLKSSLLAEISAPQLSPAQAAEVTNAINTYMGRLFPFALIACGIIVVLSDVPRLLRLGGGRGRMIQGVAIIIALAPVVIGGWKDGTAGVTPMVDFNSATLLGSKCPAGPNLEVLQGNKT
jgi:hypothetical protein